jgi:hypothetical protein
MKRIVLSTTLTFAAVTPFALQGADYPDDLNRFSFGPRFGLNYKGDFHNNPVNPGPATGGADHFYNDGYVRLDSSGDAGGLTSNWGYQNASQVVGNTMQFHAIQSSGAASTTDNPQYGGELVYQRVLGFLSPDSSSCWGLEMGFGYTDIDLRQNQSGTVPVTTDTYQLNGVNPPGPGYNGSFNGPGALLGDTPTRGTSFASLATRDKLSGSLFSFRLGPFIEWHFTHKLSVSGSVGLTLAPTRLDYDFSETTALAGGGTLVASGHSSQTKLLYGPFVGAAIHYDFTRNWDIYVGAQFQNLTDMEQSVAGRSARFDPGATVNLTAGARWSF